MQGRLRGAWGEVLLEAMSSYAKPIDREWQAGLHHADETSRLRQGLEWRVHEEAAHRRTSHRRHQNEIKSKNETIRFMRYKMLSLTRASLERLDTDMLYRYRDVVISHEQQQKRIQELEGTVESLHSELARVEHVTDQLQNMSLVNEQSEREATAALDDLRKDAASKQSILERELQKQASRALEKDEQIHALQENLSHAETVWATVHGTPVPQPGSVYLASHRPGTATPFSLPVASDAVPSQEAGASSATPGPRGNDKDGRAATPSADARKRQRRNAPIHVPSSRRPLMSASTTPTFSSISEGSADGARRPSSAALGLLNSHEDDTERAPSAPPSDDPRSATPVTPGSAATSHWSSFRLPSRQTSGSTKDLEDNPIALAARRHREAAAVHVKAQRGDTPLEDQPAHAPPEVWETDAPGASGMSSPALSIGTPKIPGLSKRSVPLASKPSWSRPPRRRHRASSVSSDGAVSPFRDGDGQTGDRLPEGKYHKQAGKRKRTTAHGSGRLLPHRPPPRAELARGRHGRTTPASVPSDPSERTSATPDTLRPTTPHTPPGGRPPRGAGARWRKLKAQAKVLGLRKRKGSAPPSRNATPEQRHGLKSRGATPSTDAEAAPSDGASSMSEMGVEEKGSPSPDTRPAKRDGKARKERHGKRAGKHRVASRSPGRKTPPVGGRRGRGTPDNQSRPGREVELEEGLVGEPRRVSFDVDAREENDDTGSDGDGNGNDSPGRSEGCDELASPTASSTPPPASDAGGGEPSEADGTSPSIEAREPTPTANAESQLIDAADKEVAEVARRAPEEAPGPSPGGGVPGCVPPSPGAPAAAPAITIENTVGSVVREVQFAEPPPTHAQPQPPVNTPPPPAATPRTPMRSTPTSPKSGRGVHGSLPYDPPAGAVYMATFCPPPKRKPPGGHDRAPSPCLRRQTRAGGAGPHGDPALVVSNVQQMIRAHARLRRAQGGTAIVPPGMAMPAARGITGHPATSPYPYPSSYSYSRTDADPIPAAPPPGEGLHSPYPY